MMRKRWCTSRVGTKSIWWFGEPHQAAEKETLLGPASTRVGRGSVLIGCYAAGASGVPSKPLFRVDRETMEQEHVHAG